MMRVCGMWKPKKADAKSIMQGFIDLDCAIVVPPGARFVVTPNRERKSDKSPSWYLWIAVDDKSEVAEGEAEKIEEPPVNPPEGTADQDSEKPKDEKVEY